MRIVPIGRSFSTSIVMLRHLTRAPAALWKHSLGTSAPVSYNRLHADSRTSRCLKFSTRSSHVEYFNLPKSFPVRMYSGVGKDVSDGEKHITQMLQKNFPKATEIDVRDVSGGCGTMYQIYLEAEEFRGKKLIEQQRMVNSVLEHEIKDMHGLSLQTAVPVKPNP